MSLLHLITGTWGQNTRLEQELQEADPGKGEGSIRQSWKLQRAVQLWLGLGIDTRTSNETLRGCRKPFCMGSVQMALLLSIVVN